MILAETDTGVVITTREQARGRLREQLGGRDLVEELLEGRRRAAALEGSE